VLRRVEVRGEQLVQLFGGDGAGVGAAVTVEHGDVVLVGRVAKRAIDDHFVLHRRAHALGVGEADVEARRARDHRVGERLVLFVLAVDVDVTALDNAARRERREFVGQRARRLAHGARNVERTHATLVAGTAGRRRRVNRRVLRGGDGGGGGGLLLKVAPKLYSLLGRVGLGGSGRDTHLGVDIGLGIRRGNIGKQIVQRIGIFCQLLLMLLLLQCSLLLMMLLLILLLLLLLL
jgi:hypothetical protein